MLMEIISLIISVIMITAVYLITKPGIFFWIIYILYTIVMIMYIAILICDYVKYRKL